MTVLTEIEAGTFRVSRPEFMWQQNAICKHVHERTYVNDADCISHRKGLRLKWSCLKNRNIR